MIDTLVVIPSYGQFNYVLACAGSLLRNTPRAACLIVDDASVDWPQAQMQSLSANPRLSTLRFSRWGGLLRSWNEGLKASQGLNWARYVCLANSDLLFPAGWDQPLRDAVDAGGPLALAGPVTNTPGSEPLQSVFRYLPSPRPKVTDEPRSLEEVQALVATAGPPVVHDINGFCLFARRETWSAHPYDSEHVFCPRNERNSRGQPVRQPLMELGEYELQKRWRAAGLVAGFVPQSYVFHYRSISRGFKHVQGKGLLMRGRHPWSLC